MNCFFIIEPPFIIVKGNTFPIKNKLRDKGARWDPLTKTWKFKIEDKIVPYLLEIGIKSIEKDLSHDSKTSSVEKNSFTLSKISVSELSEKIKILLHTHFSQPLWVFGEITALKFSHGHIFFDLTDPSDEREITHTFTTQSIACALWKGKYEQLIKKYKELPLEEGLRICLQGRLQVRNHNSSLQLVVEDLDIRHTEGELALKRKAILKKLMQKGLIHKNKNQVFPIFPVRIALITSYESRAQTDFCDELFTSPYNFKITIFSCHTQGEKTVADIVKSLDKITKNKAQFDVVVITRGGGSSMDLRWFDSMEIAEAIAWTPLPVISAIGHHEDNSIAEEVSFQKEKTPTAAADFLIRSVQNQFINIQEKIQRAVKKSYERIIREKELLSQTKENLIKTVKNRIAQEKNSIDSCQRTLKISKLMIERTQKQGFALVYDEKENLITPKHLLKIKQLPEELNIEWIDSETEEKIIVKTTPHKMLRYKLNDNNSN